MPVKRKSFRALHIPRFDGRAARVTQQPHAIERAFLWASLNERKPGVGGRTGP